MISTDTHLTIEQLKQKMRNSLLLDDDSRKYRGFIIDHINGKGFISEFEIDLFYDLMSKDFDLNTLIER